MLDLLPVFQCLRQLFAVDLDPLPLDGHETANRLEEPLELGLGERLTLERHVHGEIEQVADTQRTLFAGVDLDIDHRTRRVARFPPVRYPDDQAALLEDRDVLKKPVRLARSPGKRMIDLARLDHLLD